MATLANHPGYTLRDDAARAFDAYEAKYGRITVTSARRTPEQQQHLIDRWNTGGKYNRPPYLYKPDPINVSRHVINGGIAIDTPDYVKFAKHCREFGFVQPYPNHDPVHFEYRYTYTGPSASTSLKPGIHAVRVNDYPYATYAVARGETPSKTAAIWGMSLARYYRLNGIDPAKGFPKYPVGLQVRVAYDYRPISKRLLRHGSEGYDVAVLQEFMRRVFPAYAKNLNITGTYDTETIEVMTEFQRRSGIDVDGKTGNQTWRELGKYGL